MHSILSGFLAFQATRVMEEGTKSFWDRLGIFISGLLTILVLVSFLFFNNYREKE